MATGVRLIVFDLDGTVVDSAPAVEEAVNRVRLRKGLAPARPDEVRAMLARAGGRAGSGQSETDLLVPPGAGGKTRRDALMLFGRALAETSKERSRVYPGIRSFLEEVESRGIARALVSSRITLFVHELLEHMGLHGRFDPVVGADAVRRPPPEPDAVLRVLDRTGVEQGAAWLVSDGEAELEAGRRAGVRVAYAAYGYGRAPAREPDLVVRAPSELGSLLAGAG